MADLTKDDMYELFKFFDKDGDGQILYVAPRPGPRAPP